MSKLLDAGHLSIADLGRRVAPLAVASPPLQLPADGAEVVLVVRRPGAADPRRDDARREDRPDDAARAGLPQGPSGRHREVSRRLGAQRRRFRSRRGNSLEAWTDAYDACQKRALKTRLGIPILYGIDGVHGHNNVIGAVIFPHHIGLGCTRDPELVEEVGRITAAEIRATGIQWTFAPCVTVPRDERWGRTYEGFSEDPDVVGELGEAMTRGLQGERLSDPCRSWPVPSISSATAAPRPRLANTSKARRPSATRATASTSR